MRRNTKRILAALAALGTSAVACIASFGLLNAEQAAGVSALVTGLVGVAAALYEPAQDADSELPEGPEGTDV